MPKKIEFQIVEDRAIVTVDGKNDVPKDAIILFSNKFLKKVKELNNKGK